MRSVYDRCRAYARKCNPDLELDITHQAYILHQKSHGTNLFDRDIYVALRWCKNAFFNILNENRYQYQYENYYYKFSDISTAFNIGQIATADSELITKEFYEELYERIANYHSGTRRSCLKSSVLREYVDLLEQGYTNPEICKMLNVSQQRLHYYKLKLRSIIEQMQINNPFAGNKAKPIKKINLKQYNEKYKEEYICDFEREWCDENESTMLVVHKDKEEYILVKLSKD